MHIQIFVKHSIVMLLAAITMQGCLPEKERSKTFALKENIPLGIINLAVTGWERVPAVHSSPISSLDTQAGEKVIAVFVEWGGLNAYSEWDRIHFVETFLSDRLELIDSEGFKYPAVSAMMTYVYYFPSNYGNQVRDYVVIFHVWVDSNGYTLHLQHPEPKEGEFDVAIVSLN